MEEQSLGTQSNSVQPIQLETNLNQGLPEDRPARFDETVPRRLEWIAVVLFFASFLTMMWGVIFFDHEEAWALFTIAVSMTASVILLLSVMLSVFGKTALAKVTIGLGIFGLMITVVSIGARLMQVIAD